MRKGALEIQDYTTMREHGRGAAFSKLRDTVPQVRQLQKVTCAAQPQWMGQSCTASHNLGTTESGSLTQERHKALESVGPKGS